MKKISVRKVNNGYIVRILEQGVSEFKREYEDPNYVFGTLQEVAEFLGETFEEPVILWRENP